MKEEKTKRVSKTYKKAIPGKSFYDLFPKLMKEWDFSKNTIDPKELKPGSNIYAYWICKNCSNSYQATIYERTSGRKNCSVCSGHDIVAGINDLQTLMPDVAELLDTDIVDNVKATEVGIGSHVPAQWKCKEYNHKWSAVVKDVTSGSRCPYCSNKKVLKGFNDLKTVHPELLVDWDYEKNKIKPDEIVSGSDKKVFWICHRCGHKWPTLLKDRTLKMSECPNCTKKFHTSFPEQAIYYYVKKYFKDSVNGYRTELIDNLELDIYIPKLRIGIEYDGEKWHKQERKISIDFYKYEKCKENDIKLIRISESDDNMEKCDFKFITTYNSTSKIGDIDDVIKKLLVYLGIDEPIVDIKNDRVLIRDQYINTYDENKYIEEIVLDAVNKNGFSYKTKAYKNIWYYHDANGLSLEAEIKLANQLKRNGFKYSMIQKWLLDDYNYNYK